MDKITSLLFIFLMYCILALNALVVLTFSWLFGSYKLTHLTIKYWAKAILILNKYINGVNYKILGLENLPKEPCIIACKHQSSWDTIIFQTLLENYPAYVYKEELHKIPIYGWYIKKSKMIPVDRQGSAKSLKQMLRRSKECLKQNQKIVIFPQGTRVPVGSDTKDHPYNVGVAALYKSCNVKVIPIALNSGKAWPKGCKITRKQDITMKILKPIEPGLNKEEFMKVLEDKIESESEGLL